MQHDTHQLQQFVDAGKNRGASDEFLASLLIRRGWSADEVYGALGAYWEQLTGVPIPDRRPGGESSRDAFFYLLSFATLAAWSTALGSMLFEFINHWLPDATRANRFTPDLRLSVTWQMATIAVAFPIYMIVMRLIFGEVANDPDRLQSGVRKWLTWLALLITAGTMIGDLTCFLDYFLTGELTLRFVFKCAVVLVIAGAVFAWYMGSLRWTKLTPVEGIRTRARLFAGGAGIAVTAAFCIGLGVAGSPATQRHAEADNRRVQDLRLMAQRRFNKAQNQPILRDPETGAPYEYRALEGTIYELCASFRSASPENSGTFWTHSAGRTCFRLDSSTVTAW